MGSRFVRPETAKLPISDGEWILVRRRLTAGEQRQASARLIKTASMAGNGQPAIEFDPTQVGLTNVLAYLLDWSFPEYEIRGEGLDVIAAAVDALDPATYDEILAAVTAHEAAMVAERAQEKKVLTGASAS